MMYLRKNSVIVMLFLMMLVTVPTSGMPINLEGITREEGAIQLVQMLGYGGIAEKYSGEEPFDDLISSHGDIYLVKELGIMSGVGEERFDPRGVITSYQNEMIGQRLGEVMASEIPWVHGFYAIASSSQMESIQYLDAVSFGWAQLVYDSVAGSATISTNSTNNYGFKVPSGFQVPIDYAKEHGVETYLMIFFDDMNGHGLEILTDEAQVDNVISQIVAVCNDLTHEGLSRSFDGITIDFEGFISEALREPFNVFLAKLEGALTLHGKKLNVAVQPSLYYKGYDYRAIGDIADKVILMAHDYDAKQLTDFDKAIGNTYTPLTPIADVYRDLEAIMDPLMGVADKSKIVLQIAFGSAQWQMMNGQVIHDFPYTPSYDRIYERHTKDGVEIKFDVQSGNPYTVYTENGITNRIWYENEESVQLKTQLVRFFDLGGISYWRLGTIPEFMNLQLKVS